MKLGQIVTTKEILFKDGSIQYPSKTGKIVKIETTSKIKVLHILSLNKSTGKNIISICSFDQIESTK